MTIAAGMIAWNRAVKMTRSIDTCHSNINKTAYTKTKGASKRGR